MIVGIDEVGRGCWAGPVVAGAVVLKRRIPGLKDSKKLTKLQREVLDQKIRRQAVAIGLGWVAPSEIDELGLTKAVGLAMRRALAQIETPYEKVIIDGNHNYLQDIAGTECMIKADDSIASVSAASIVAKVARDAYMAEIAAQHPGYAFERHVGYGTAAHQAALADLGVCDIHRRSFAPIQALLGTV